MECFRYRLLRLVFWLIKAGKDLFVWKQIEIVREGIWKKKEKVPNVSFYYFLIFSWYEILTVSTLLFHHLAAYTYFPALTAYLLVAHIHAAPNLALGVGLQAAVIAGTDIAPFCVGLVKDTWGLHDLVVIPSSWKYIYGVMMKPLWHDLLESIRDFLSEHSTRIVARNKTPSTQQRSNPHLNKWTTGRVMFCRIGRAS